VIKLNLSSAMIKLIYKFVDVEFSGNVAVPDDRMIEYSYAISNVIKNCPSGSKILDVGCVARINVVPQTLCELDFKVTGIDVRNFLYKHPNFDFIQGSMKDYDFGAVKFDAVTLISSLEHIGIKGRYGISNNDDDADFNTIAKSMSILKKSGIVILTVPFSTKSQRYGIHRLYDKETLTKLFGTKSKILDERYYKQVDGILEYDKKGTDKSHLACLVVEKL
jgi:hypothetical protein